MPHIAFAAYYRRYNRYSFNALIGALEKVDHFSGLPIYIYHDQEGLLAGLNDIIPRYDKVILGFSFCTPQIWEFGNLIHTIREHYHDAPLIIIAGGPHPTAEPLATLKMGCDTVVVGEGEETLIAILEGIERGEDYTHIKGIAFLDDEGNYCFTGKRDALDLDDYPPFAVEHQRFGPIEITRGCPYGCYFCQTPHLFGARIRHRSLAHICNYAGILKERGIHHVRFITPNAFSYGSKDGKTVYLPALEGLLSAVKKIMSPDGRIFFGSFPSEVRPEHVSKRTIDLIMTYAHNDNLVIGAQSGSQRILDHCHRGHTVKDIYHATELTLQAGLKAYIDIVFGLPEETKEDICSTMIVMKDLIRMGARIHAHTFMPLPQTPFSKAPPGKIDRHLKEMIAALPKGCVFGDWIKQEEIAQRIGDQERPSHYF